MNSYTKTNWVNGQAPALSAENLNKIENGIEAVTNAATDLEANKINIAVAYNKDKATLQDGQIHIDDAVANDTIYLIKNSNGTTVGKLFSAGVDGNYYKRIQLRLLGGGNPEISCRIIEYQANPEDPPTVGSWTKLAYAPDIPDVSGKEDKSNKASAITSANKGSTTDYPNVKATVDYIDAVVAAISTLSFEVVQTKPTQNIKTNVIYLIPKVATETNNVYEEWIYVNNDWELLGTTSIDLSAKEDKTNKVSSFGVGEVDDVHYPTTRAVQRLLNSSVPTKTSDLTNDSGFLTAHQDVSGKEDKSNKSDNFDFNLTPTTAERSKYPTVARMKELLAGTYYDMDEIDNMIGNIESLLSQV